MTEPPAAGDDDRDPDPVVAETAEPARRPARARTGGARWRSALAMLGLAFVAFSIGVLVFNNLIMPRLIHSVGQVRVPDVTGLTLEQAEQALTPLDLKLSRAGERFEPSVPRGMIISQDPAPETAVRGRKLVTVLVSLGEEFSSVPALFGESLRGARHLLERSGLKMGAITRAPSDEVGDGLVAGSDPPAESVLPRGTAVHLLLSSGAGEESFVMPDLLGREISGVRRQLEGLGFRVFTPPAAPSIGTIVHQEPAAGSRITRNATILLQATGRIIR
jgi:serine/threonine-protein kinase